MRRGLCFLAVLAALICAGCSAGPTAAAGRITVLASWTGAEGAAFGKVLDEFTRETGIAVDYEGTRAVGPVLDSDLQQGNPPDVAVLPNPGALATYMRSGDLRKLDAVVSDPGRSFSAQWLRLQRLGSAQHLYAIAVKADLKSIIWYDPERFSGPVPRTWADLMSLTGPGRAKWCMGLQAPPTTGWPGTDWIEDILLHQSGAKTYARWASGELPWTSRPVERAWSTWGAVVAAVHGGRHAATMTNFGDAGRGMFADPQRCAFEHEGSFIMSNYQGYPGRPRPGVDFDYFPFPSADGSAEVSADLAGLFTDSPQAKRFMQFLAGERAQRIWPAIPGYGAFSPNKNVGGDNVYRDPVSRRIAATLTSKGPLCFDAADLMPAAMSAAFSRAVLEFMSDPGRLPGLLQALQKVSDGLDKADWLGDSCG